MKTSFRFIIQQFLPLLFSFTLQNSQWRMKFPVMYPRTLSKMNLTKARIVLSNLVHTACVLLSLKCSPGIEVFWIQNGVFKTIELLHIYIMNRHFSSSSIEIKILFMHALFSFMWILKPTYLQPSLSSYVNLIKKKRTEYAKQ